MVSGERLRITLTGGAPWGFRLQGGGNFPLEVAKIRKRSSAAESGLKEGDHVVSINGYPLSGRSHQSAMDIVEMASNTLDFEIIRSGSQASKPLDPQRMSRGPVVTQEAGSTKVSSAHSSFSTHNGNVRTDVKTAQYVMNIPGGSGTLVTKTVTQKSSSQFPSLGGALSPVPDGGHVSRSPRRSPVMWSPPSKSASPASAKSPAAARSPLMWQPPSVSENQPYLRSTEPPRQQSPQVWQHHSLSPAPPGSRSRSSSAGNLTQGKENADPAHIMMSEQAKWEARHKHELETANVATNYYGSLKATYKAPKMSDPNYPMFEIPKPEWKPAPKIVEPLPENKKPEPPPVAPKPQMSDFHPTEAPVAGTDRHYPGMIRPPQQPNVAPPPPPPPMPPAPAPKNIPMFKPRKLVTHAEDEEEHHHRPDHLPVFGPRVMFAYDEDSGMAMSPDRSDQVSDISSIARKKLYSDSTFYDDANHRFPTIDEQMSMCKRIAESLTSVANKKARGARMFANRKRKANKWVHEHCLEYGVCECSSAGDVADLDELDSELFYDEGGSKPLFTFRIPKIAGQVTEGERMSLSKQEFERLRLMAPKTDHNAVSPNQCFNIAADLHRGGKNKGAKLFQKRQARVEKYVIDETNVNRAPPAPTKLEKIIQTPPIGKSPWNAAAGGSVPFPPSQTYATMPLPRHNLTTEQSPKLIEGHNFNTKARGWGSGPGHQQHSYYRESMDIHQNVAESSESHTETPHQTTSSYQTWTEQQTSSSVTDPQGTSKFGDYNRRVKAWPGSGEPTETHAIRSYSEQTNYNSLPRGFGGHQRPQFEAKSQYGYCDL